MDEKSSKAEKKKVSLALKVRHRGGKIVSSKAPLQGKNSKDQQPDSRYSKFLRTGTPLPKNKK